MKNLLILIIIVGISLNLSAQKMRSVEWYNWSNPISYQLSPSPYSVGYGFYSDSLSKINNGATFYEANGEYYQIESWADYYFWYVNEYWYQFQNPELYEYFYGIKDDFQMAKYIAGRSYQGRYYPSDIYLVFNGKEVDYNRLNKNSRYVASNERQIRRLNRKMEYLKELVGKDDNDSKSNTGNTVYLKKSPKKNEFIRYDNHRLEKKEVKLNSYNQNKFKSKTVYRKPVSNTNNSSKTTNKKNSNAPKQK